LRTYEAGVVGYSSANGPPPSGREAAALGDRTTIGFSASRATCAYRSSPVTAWTRTKKLAACPWAIAEIHPAGSANVCG
jgi:hypothetical protein